MRTRFVYAAVVAALLTVVSFACSGCSSFGLTNPSPTTPAQRYFAAKVDYLSALDAARTFCTTIPRNEVTPAVVRGCTQASRVSTEAVAIMELGDSILLNGGDPEEARAVLVQLTGAMLRALERARSPVPPVETLVAGFGRVSDSNVQNAL